MKTSIGLNGSSQCAVREQDRFMPIANVIRIMRKVLPTHAKISDDAKETIQECVSEYISFITSEANERCQREQRKTITAEDVLWAMNKLGFDDYVDPLSVFLRRYRELEGDHRGSVRGDPLQLRRPAFAAAAEADDESAGAGISNYGLHQHVSVSGLHQYQVYGSGPYGDPGAGSSVQPTTDFDLYSAYKSWIQKLELRMKLLSLLMREFAQKHLC